MRTPFAAIDEEAMGRSNLQWSVSSVDDNSGEWQIAALMRARWTRLPSS